MPLLPLYNLSKTIFREWRGEGGGGLRTGLETLIKFQPRKFENFEQKSLVSKIWFIMNYQHSYQHIFIIQIKMILSTTM